MSIFHIPYPPKTLYKIQPETELTWAPGEKQRCYLYPGCPSSPEISLLKSPLPPYILIFQPHPQIYQLNYLNVILVFL
jgi:hypothetical protein